VFNALAPHRGYDPQLGQMGADGVDHRGLLSRPMVVSVCMIGSSESWGLNSTPNPWHSCAGEGAVHSINSGHSEERRLS
jgi:hypothetical protein